MTVNQIKDKLKTSEYDFLRTNEHLGNNVIMLTLGGSHAYGTNVETSDVDIRGCALNTKEEILTNKNFEQFTNDDTDTVIYSFNKLIHLLSNCNPNVIELCGNRPEHYIYLSTIGKELLDNASMFLSQKAVYTFGGYASQQLWRLKQLAVRYVPQSDKEYHILKSIENASVTFPESYFEYPDDAIKLYIDKSEREEYDTEIFMDINLKHYPLRDYKSMWSEMNNVVKDYAKIGSRNSKAIEHNKINKHAMHLIRLYLMCLDILNEGKIVTYREKDHDFLMDIRNGKYLSDDNQMKPEFFDIVAEYENKMDIAKSKTELPAAPDYNKINKFVMSVNERVVRGEIDV